MKTSKLGALLLNLAVCASTAVAIAPQVMAQSPYRIIDKWSVGGSGGWDYLAVDSAAHRLYITHGTRLEVLDTATGKSVGAITGFKGLHGVAFDTAGKFGFVSDGGANEVVVFDRSKLTRIASIPTGMNPDGILFEPKTQTIWTFNGRGKNATVIDSAKRSVVATIPLPGKPEFPAADGSGTVFVNIEDKNEIIRLDAATKKATATWPLSGCDSPSGLAIDISGHRLFSVCDGKKMIVTDSATGKRLALPDIGEGPDATAYYPANKLAFSSDGGGTLTVIDASKPSYPVLQTLPTTRGARTMAFDPSTGKVFLVTADFGPPPAATADNPHPWPTVVPGSFRVLVVGR
jgi:DNA-binding beta-propeller fold protein YncE